MLVGAQWLRPSIAGSVRAGMQGAKDYEKGEHVQGVVLTTDAWFLGHHDIAAGTLTSTIPGRP